MTMQICDLLYLPFKNKKYSMLAYENDWLINIDNLGIAPVVHAILTCNWKGYESEYVIKDNKYLYWDYLMFRAKEGVFPPINGVTAKLTVTEFKVDGETEKDYFMEYKNIMKVPYTGGIILGDGLIRRLGENQGYQYPHIYKEVLECRFKCGELVCVKDYSDEMRHIRKRLEDKFIIEELSRRFLFNKFHSQSYKDKWKVYKYFKLNY